MAEEGSMWHDPLDELIDELDEIPSVQPMESPQQRFAQLIWYTDVILYGSEERKRRLKTAPGYQRFLADLRGTTARSTPRPGRPGEHL
jgi:hypothetical protein